MGNCEVVYHQSITNQYEEDTGCVHLRKIEILFKLININWFYGTGRS